MSDGDKVPDEDVHEEEASYKPPPEKSLKEIVEADKEDESLQKYKEALLGQAVKESVVVVPGMEIPPLSGILICAPHSNRAMSALSTDGSARIDVTSQLNKTTVNIYSIIRAVPGLKSVFNVNNPSRVIVKNLALVVDGRPDVVLDLTDDLENLKKKVFVVKEGIQYRIRIDFYVQREIVTGLKYVQKVLRHGIQHEKITHMVGSYAPKLELQSYCTPVDEMPSGLLTRGTYTVKSLFTDDDKNEHLKWEWSFELKKDWE